jgi:hypothetical protein
MHDFDSNFKDTVGGQAMKFSFRPTYSPNQTDLCVVIAQNFQCFTQYSLLRYFYLEMYDLDRLFQGQRWKMVHFQSKRPSSRQIWIISSSNIKTNIRRQNLFKRNFHFGVKFSNFHFFLHVSPISLYDTSFCSP